VGTGLNTVLFTKFYCLFHNRWIGGMKTAGNVSGGDMPDDFLVAANFIGAEGFTHITIKINANFHKIVLGKES
jgi:hypothetical protein